MKSPAITYCLFMSIQAAPVMAMQAPPAAPSDVTVSADSLVTALRHGGYVVVFRHAHTDRSKMDDRDWSLSNRSTQRNLSDRGADDARRIGQAMASSRIPVGEILASPMFRTRETAEHAFGRAESTELLRSRRTTPEARALLTTGPERGVNRVLVTHNAYINRYLSAHGHGRIGEGDAVVVRPLADGKYEVLGRITLEQWLELARSAYEERSDSPHR
ncbi:MAG TPA: histidine phosphatase family protein [Gemmatimonadaceae bacterium]|nr:histidine phosphatase family protein [Gemmatimonadaceae bacterium]